MVRDFINQRRTDGSLPYNLLMTYPKALFVADDLVCVSSLFLCLFSLSCTDAMLWLGRARTCNRCGWCRPRRSSLQRCDPLLASQVVLTLAVRRLLRDPLC